MADGVTSSVVARKLGIAQRSVNRLAERGVISCEMDERGYRIFDLDTAAREYAEHAEQGAFDADGVDWSIERMKADTRIKRARADILELERKEMLETYHRAEFVEDATNELLAAISLELLSLPDRLAPITAAQTDTSDISAAIKREVVAALERLARFEYRPGQYQSNLEQTREGQEG